MSKYVLQDTNSPQRCPQNVLTNELCPPGHMPVLTCPQIIGE